MAIELRSSVEDASSYGEPERPEESGMRIVDVPLLPAFFHDQDGGIQADRSGRSLAPTCLFGVRVYLITGHAPSFTLTLFVHTVTANASDEELPQTSTNGLNPPRFEVSFSHGPSPVELAVASSSLTSDQGFHDQMTGLHASVLHEQHLFHLQIHHPVQAAQMWYSNLLGRVHSTNQTVRRMVAKAQACVILATLLVCFSVGSLLGGYRSAASAHYVVCEAYLVWTLHQLENVIAPTFAVLRERERRLTLILHSLRSIQLSAEGIDVQSNQILRRLVVAIACHPGPGPPASWTTRMNRMLLNYEERGLDLASQISHLVDIVIATMQTWDV